MKIIYRLFFIRLLFISNHFFFFCTTAFLAIRRSSTVRFCRRSVKNKTIFVARSLFAERSAL